MTTAPVTPYRSQAAAGRESFWHLVHAEWTKFRTVRGWMIAMIVAIMAITAFVFLAGNVSSSCSGSACPAPPAGPGGEPVTDAFYFAHQPLTGNGTITVQITSLTRPGQLTATLSQPPSPPASARPPRRRPLPQADPALARPRRPHQRVRASRIEAQVKTSGQVLEPHRILRTAVQAPRMNASCERLVGTLRRELLDCVLILGERHLHAVLAGYQMHYNTARPHQGIARRVPDDAPDAPHVTVTGINTQQIRRKPVLGGLINEYTRVARRRKTCRSPAQSCFRAAHAQVAIIRHALPGGPGEAIIEGK